MLISESLFTKEIYPLQIKNIEDYDGYLSSGDSSFFVFKENWADYLTKAIKFENNKQIEYDLGNFEILDINYFEGNFYTIINDYEELKIIIFNSNLEIIKSSTLPSKIIEREFIEVNQSINTINNPYSIIINQDIYLLINGIVFLYDSKKNKCFEIGRDVISIDNYSGKLYILKQQSRNLILEEYAEGKSQVLAIFESIGHSELVVEANSIFVITELNKLNIIVKRFNMTGIFVSQKYINSEFGFFDIEGESIYFISEEMNIKSISKYSFVENKVVDLLEVTPQYVNPLILKVIGKKIYCLFQNAIFLMDTNGNLLLESTIDFTKIIDTKIKIKSKSNNQINISSKNKSFYIELEEVKFYRLQYYLSKFEEYITSIILFILLLIIFRLYRKKNRIYKELLDLPGAGIVMIFDRHGKLSAANVSAREFLSMPYNFPKLRNYSYYLDKDNSKPFLKEIEKAYKEKINYQIKLTIKDSLEEEKEWLTNIIIVRNPAGLFRGVVLTSLDITEQLERKRLYNWAQFAHDMQTNISAIRLNAEAMDLEEQDSNSKKVEKILHQTKLLMQRIRDIVTVGRSEKLELGKYNAEEICREVLAEFDDTMFPNVIYELDTEPFLVKCDRPKFLRALRNSVENGIKAMRAHSGKIIISCKKDGNHAKFTIEDSGEGMDETTQEKILKPFFTTRRKSGGSGIGTMIMQQVIEMHKGKIIIDSEKGKGTKITFIIPNY